MKQISPFNPDNLAQTDAEPLAKPSEIVEAVAVLFATRRRKELSDEDIKLEISAFIIAGEDYPISAIRAAVKSFIKGRVIGDDSTYMPTATQFAKQCMLEFERQRAAVTAGWSDPGTNPSPPVNLVPSLPKHHFLHRWPEIAKQNGIDTEGME